MSSGALYWATHPTSRSPWATGRLSVTVIVEKRAVENAVPWTKVGAADWATAGDGRRTPRAAIAAMAAVDRADRKCLTVISLPCDTCSAPPRAGEDGNDALGHAARSVSSVMVCVALSAAWLR